MFKVGFDVGGTNIAAGLVDDNGKILARAKQPFPTGMHYVDVAAVMRNMTVKLALEKKARPEDIQTIGIAMPGSLDIENGMVISAHNLQFYNVPFREAMEELFPGIPVFLGNDADAAALGEYKAGALKECRTGVLLTLGTGIGGGLILGGKLYRGSMGNGIEPGHMIMSGHQDMCTCGNRGCIEAVCAATWLVRQGRKAIIEYPSSQIHIKTKGDVEKVDAKLVIDSAKEGDTIALSIFERYLDSLSDALVSFAVLLDPEIIALGGGVSGAGDFLFHPLRELVQKKNFFKFPYKIIPAELGNDAGIIGAAMLSEY